MRRFILPAAWDGAETLELGAADSRRLTVVLRLKPGDEFPALAADGRACHCRIQAVAAGRVRLAVHLSAAPGDPEVLPDLRAGRSASSAGLASPLQAAAAEPIQTAPAQPTLSLALGILKGSKLDDVVRMAAEAGVARLYPLACSRSVPRGEMAGRIDRLRRIVREAVGQSAASRITEIHAPLSPAELAAACRQDLHASRLLGLVFHERPLASQTIHQYCSGDWGEVLACIGPEGGFDPDELASLQTAGFRPAWLGPTVLRAESAALFALASLHVINLERNSWIRNE